MGAPDPGLAAAEQKAAETLLSAFRTIKPAERAKHEQVLDYWLSIRGDKEFPPLHDLDPLELSDAGPCSILLELISGGQDAEVRHLGDALHEDRVERIIDAPNPSILSSIARKLPIVAISRDFLAFEDSYNKGGSPVRCWVTLLPLSSCGSWVDYVYAFVTTEASSGKTAHMPDPGEPAEEAAAEEADMGPESSAEEPEAEADIAPFEPEQSEPAAEIVPFAPEEPATPVEEIFELEDTADQQEIVDEVEKIEADEEPAEAGHGGIGPGFSRLLEGFANLTGFYGQGVQTETIVPAMELTEVERPAEEVPVEKVVAVEPEAIEPPIIEPEAFEAPAEAEELVIEPVKAEPIALQPVDEVPPAQEAPEAAAPETAAPEPAQPQQPAPAMEGTLQSKLAEVQAKADEAREAQLRATKALHEGLSAAYDFSLEAETSPEEYLRLVEAQGLKIQLRAPMAPVAKLAFDGVCDVATIRQFEAVLAWALKVELPRGALLERIEQAGGIPELLNEFARAA